MKSLAGADIMFRKGVTIVELVVVLAIIAIMAGLFFPAVQRAREAARETVCKNNVGQINLSMSMHSEAAGVPDALPVDTVDGWTVAILPFLDQGNLHDEIPKGALVAELPDKYFTPPRVFRCPTQSNIRSSDAGSVSPAHYVLMTNRPTERDGYSVADAPLSLNTPWISSPEIPSTYFTDNEGQLDGPHNGRFHRATGFRQGVNLFPRQ